MAKDYTLEKRKLVIGGVAIVIVIIYIMRLFVLQIMTDTYKKNADSNAFLNKIQYPSRGAIYDRNGKLLVFNQPAYDITFVPREVTELDTLDFCRTLNITKEQLLKRMKDVKNRWMNPGYSRYTHQVFMTQLSAEECGVFQEKLFKFPGFYIQRRTIRQYTYNAAGHALGDIGEVSMRDIEADDYYIRGDYVGKQGIEKSYEKYLRGELVEPAKPIVFYIENSTPYRWRKYIKQGIEDWQVAFEHAGFKNAIIAKDITDSMTVDMDDVNYSVLTYAASTKANAMGPSILDPRSGEILEADIMWWHNVLNMLQEWITVQTGTVRPEARGIKLSDELMGDAMRFVACHEVGHSLGLRHNMMGSWAFPTDSLRSKSFTDRMNSTSSSIMDYAR